MPKAIDLTGQRFVRIRVIKYYGKEYGSKARKWYCLCDCGKELLCSTTDLRSGDTTSCGCKRNERVQLLNKTHGLTKTNEYAIWLNIIQRCTNINNPGYKNYGGRGISISDEWRNSFLSFLNDIGKRPSLLHSVERLDNNKNYCKENCVWALKDQQANNTRGCRFITFNGKTQSLKRWAKEIGIGNNSLQRRFDLHGWSIEKALTTPRQRIGRPKSKA